jgi:tryptophan synthase alpha chain
MSNSIMCHMVAGFPSEQHCLELVEGLLKLPIAALEVQIPFSDPIADGEAIMEANDVALSNGMTMRASFKFIEKIRTLGFAANIFIMSYAQKIQHFGFTPFCEQAAKMNIKGFIIPDLPFDSKDFQQLKLVATDYCIELVPVLSPGMSEERLDRVMVTQPRFVYLTSRKGITGNAYSGSEDLKIIAKKIKLISGVSLMIGFGITTGEDVKNALTFGDTAVIGSAIVRSLQSSDVSSTLTYIKSLISDVTKVDV